MAKQERESRPRESREHPDKSCDAGAGSVVRQPAHCICKSLFNFPPQLPPLLLSVVPFHNEAGI